MATQALTSLAADRLIADFDRAWQTGPAPELVAYVRRLPEPGTPEEDRLRRETFEELVRIDLEYRWRPGSGARSGQPAEQRPLLDQYLQAGLERWVPLSV